MTSFYKRLVAEKGEDGAKEYMRELRTKVKRPGFAASDHDFARQMQAKSVISRLENKRKRHDKLPQETQDS